MTQKNAKSFQCQKKCFGNDPQLSNNNHNSIIFRYVYLFLIWVTEYLKIRENPFSMIYKKNRVKYFLNYEIQLIQKREKYLFVKISTKHNYRCFLKPCFFLMNN